MSIVQQLDICLRILIAALLSAIIGYDRQRRLHAAGLRTHMLIGIGAALFTALSVMAFPGGDQERVAAQIVVGVGFLEGGTILQNRGSRRVHGMTTAADIWVVAAIGMACGLSVYLVATVVTVMAWLILAMVRRLERDKSNDDEQDTKTDRDNSRHPRRPYSSARLPDRRPPGSR